MLASKSQERREQIDSFIRSNWLWRSSYLRSTEDFFPDALYLALATLYSLIGATINWDLLEFRKDKRLFITQ